MTEPNRRILQELFPLKKTFETVKFSLELITNHASDENLNRIFEEAEQKVKNLYPQIELDGVRIFGAEYGGKYRGPAILGSVNEIDFRKVFGNRVQRRLTITVGPGIFIVPLGAYFRWYQTGELNVPDNLKDIAKGIYVYEAGYPSPFGEIRMFKPKNAEQYDAR